MFCFFGHFYIESLVRRRLTPHFPCATSRTTSRTTSHAPNQQQNGINKQRHQFDTSLCSIAHTSYIHFISPHQIAVSKAGWPGTCTISRIQHTTNPQKVIFEIACFGTRVAFGCLPFVVFVLLSVLSSVSLPDLRFSSSYLPFLSFHFWVLPPLDPLLLFLFYFTFTMDRV